MAIQNPVTNRRVPTSGADFYPTPTWVTEALLGVESFNGKILEPACGDGAIVKVLEAAGCRVDSADLFDWGYGKVGRDFLNFAGIADNVVTNPPYTLAEKFVMKSLQVTTEKVALFLRLAFLESQRRQRSIFSKTPPTRVWVFSERVTMYPSGVQTAGSGTTAYAWFVWDKTCGDDGCRLGWIAPRGSSAKKKPSNLKLSDLFPSKNG